MKKNKIISVLALSLAVVGLAACGGNKEEVDPTLYHLTFSSNKDIDMSKVKATYAYGTGGSTVVKEGTRDADDIAALKKAGASQADIDKAGKRQEDGSYYFFDQDPMYLEAPTIEGYRTPTFYNKANGDAFKPGLHRDAEGKQQLYFWNMPQADTELEIRYESVQYEIAWQTLTDADKIGYNNPNSGRLGYTYELDGVLALEPATFTNKNITFIGWEYQDVHQEDEHGYAKWVLMEDNKLPIDIDDNYLRVQPRYEVKKFKVEFAVEDTEGTKLDLVNTITSMELRGNLMTIDGEPYSVGSEPVNIPVDLSKEYKVDCLNGWADFFFTLNPAYRVFYLKLNGERNDTINASHLGYVDIKGTDLTEDSVVTFVLAEKIPE